MFKSTPVDGGGVNVWVVFGEVGEVLFGFDVVIDAGGDRVREGSVFREELILEGRYSGEGRDWGDM